MALLPVQGVAHGIKCSMVPGEAAILTATTVTGDPIPFADVQIFAPDNDSVEFANGRTDRAGRFAFVPNRSGSWKVRLEMESDHGPHVFTSHFEVDEALEVVPFAHGADWGERAAAAGGMLLAVSGWSAYWLERRRRVR